MTDQDRVLEFIRRHMAATGSFPTNKQITSETEVFYWRVGSILTALVAKGHLRRTQIAEKGTRHQPKYAYELVKVMA